MLELLGIVEGCAGIILERIEEQSADIPILCLIDLGGDSIWVLALGIVLGLFKCILNSSFQIGSFIPGSSEREP